MSDNFWNDELVKEYVRYVRDFTEPYSTVNLNSFKQSKQQSKNNQDWEILERFNYNEGAFDGDIAPIKSVKVLSSGEIFSINDEVEIDSLKFYIEKFSIEGNLMHVYIKHSGIVNLSALKKYKPILFTTETIMANKKQTVTLEIDDAVNVASDLADLLCWWEGFKVGRQSAGTDYFMVAENGISAAGNLNEKIKAALK